MPPGRDKLNLRRSGAHLGLMVLLLLAGACSRPESDRFAPVPNVLRISQRNEPSDLDPATAALPDEFFIIRALSEGLVVPVRGADPQPAAAASWDISADGLRYTFHLRPDGVWSNGEAVTAQDFVDSFRRVLSPATAARKAELFFSVKNARAFLSGNLKDFNAVGFHATDARTLIVTLDRPSLGFLRYAASGPWIPVNPRVVQREGRTWTSPGSYVGNGPYLLQEWLPGQRIIVRKNPLYRQAAAIHLQEIRFIRLDDGESEDRSYRAGEIDLTMGVPEDKLRVYAKDRPNELHRAALLETRYLAFNTQREPLNDSRVRQALSLALDRQRLVHDVLHGGQIPARWILPGATSNEHPALPSGYDREQEQARALLRAAGFPNGQNFPRLELSEPVSWQSTLVLEAIQAMWKQTLGIEMAIAVREARVHVAALRSGRYDIGFITLIPDVDDPVAVLRDFTTASPNNYPHWSDRNYDALVEQAGQSGDPGAQRHFLREAQARLLDAQPLAPLYFNTQNWLMRPYVHGWQQDALWNRYYPGLWLDKR